MAPKKKTTKKPTKAKTTNKRKTIKKTSAKKDTPKITSPQMVPSAASSVESTQNPKSFNMVIMALVLIVLGMGYMRFKHLLMPATVNGSPIFAWEYVKVLHQTSGTQVLDQLVVEKLIEQEAQEKNVQVSDEEMQAEFNRLEAQFESVGGLEAFLSTQGLSKKDIDSQVSLNLKVQKIVAEKVSVSDEAVDEYYAENADQYAEVTTEEAKGEIAKILVEQELQQQIGIWIQDLRSQAQVTINIPGQEPTIQ